MMDTRLRHLAFPFVSPCAVDQACALGLPGGRGKVESLLRLFWRNSALVTHMDGKRRYGGYVLDSNEDDSEIVGIYKFEDGPVCPDCFGTGKVDQFDSYAHHWVRVPCVFCK